MVLSFTFFKYSSIESYRLVYIFFSFVHPICIPGIPPYMIVYYIYHFVSYAYIFIRRTMCPVFTLSRSFNPTTSSANSSAPNIHLPDISYRMIVKYTTSYRIHPWQNISYIVPGATYRIVLCPAVDKRTNGCLQYIYIPRHVYTGFAKVAVQPCARHTTQRGLNNANY